MRITDDVSPTQTERTFWELYQGYEDIFGHVLDDKFENPHVNVYEHERFSNDEMFYHPPSNSSLKEGEAEESGELAKEEVEIQKILMVDERERLLRVVGDVGVGKTTFMRHLCTEHFGTEAFGFTKPIYLDWGGFTASSVDPLPQIYAQFVEDVYTVFSDIMGIEEQIELDEDLFESSSLFSTTRTAQIYTPDDQKAAEKRLAIKKMIEQNPVDFAFARINHLSRDNKNKFTIIIDNVDHLGAQILDDLLQFVLELQVKVASLVILALRDHTEERGFSSYKRDAVKPSWLLRLYAPDIRRLVHRRMDYFFPTVYDSSKHRSIQVNNVSIKINRNGSEKVCRKLLSACLDESQNYEFLINWCNFNIRELFRVMQYILGYPGFSKFNSNLLDEEGELPIDICIDQSITALALRNRLLFYPNKSILFNPYSAGQDATLSSHLVGVRLLQYLASKSQPVKYMTLTDHFTRWGYSEAACRLQISAMLSKDVIWSSTGDPRDIEAESDIRLSYRGLVYHNKLLGRMTFNYLVLFNVRAPSPQHPLVKHYKSQFRDEIESFANFDNPIHVDAVIERVLALVDVLCTAERNEIKTLHKDGHLGEFRNECSPRSISIIILEGLILYLNSVIEIGTADETRRRKAEQPSSRFLSSVSELKSQIIEEYGFEYGHLER